MANSVLDIAKKINKDWKKDILTDCSVLPECGRFSMGSIAADYPLFGGIPLGCIIVFAGVEFSGKTISAIQAIADYQKEFPEKTCILVDGEKSSQTQLPFWRSITGLNTSKEKLQILNCTGLSAEEIFEALINIETEADNVGLIVIDSAPSLVSQADMDNDFTKDNGQRASISKSLGKFCRMMQQYLPARNNSLLIINQVREAGKTFTGATIYTEPCGYALKYYPSVKVRFATRKYTLGDKVDLPKGDEADGFRLSFSITKNRLGPTNRGGGYITYRYNTGLDVVGDTLEVAMKFGFINRPNNQTYELINLDTGEIYVNQETGEQLRFRGKQNLIDFMKENVDFRDQYIEMLNKYMTKQGVKSLLDEETLKEITTQEDSVAGNISEAEKREAEEDPGLYE